METGTLISRASERLGIGTLTPMQSEMARIKLPCRVLLLAPTGSGKTLAFAVAMLRGIKAGEKAIKALVLVPTRELALQVYEVVRSLAQPELKTVALYGGHKFETETKSLEAGADIVVATPGRLLDHLQRGSAGVHDVSVLVLDEYDKSLELGFLGEMRSIAGRLKNVKSLILTSATRLAEMPDFLGTAPIKCLDYATGEDAARPDVLFERVDSPSADKLETLDALLRDLQDGRVIVFVNHRDAAERVYRHLLERKFPAGLYHGGLEQDVRERALVLLANGTTPVLVSTDLASRGLDIDSVGAVVHYHLPVSEEAMTHRNGRTGRMGASGRAFAIISDTDKVPDFFPALDTYWPEGTAPVKPSPWATLHFNAGRKDKISKGDIAGFLMQKGGLGRDEVGRIDVKDHQAYAAVPADKARATAAAVAPYKVKNTRVRVTQLK